MIVSARSKKASMTVAALVAAREPVEAVVPGVGALDVPPLAGLDRRLLALVRDFAGHAAGGEFGAGLVRVVAGVQVDGDVVGQRPEVIQQVQRGGQQRGVVAVRPGQDPAERYPVTIRHARAFQALFATVDRDRPATSPPPGALVMEPSMAIWSSMSPTIRS